MISADVNRGGLTAQCHQPLAWHRCHRRHRGWGSAPTSWEEQREKQGPRMGVGQETGNPAQQEGPDSGILSHRPQDTVLGLGTQGKVSTLGQQEARMSDQCNTMPG